MNEPLSRPVVLVAHSGAELYGADRVLLESVTGMVARGLRVVVTLPSGGALVAELERAGATVVIVRVPVLRKSFLSVAGLFTLARESMSGAWRGARLIRRIGPDLLYVNTVTIPLWPVLGRLAGRRVLVHVHEAERTARKALRVALAAPLLCATTIVANSRYSADTLAQTLPRLRARTTVIYNGVPGPAQPVPPRSAVESPLRVLYVGRLSSRKGVHTAIAAVASARDAGLDVQLDLVGAVFPGYEWYADQLHEQVEQLGLDGSVTFHGFQGDVWAFYAAADVAIVPSGLDEPFGDTAVEALLAARPLIVSRTPGLSEAAGGFDSVQFVDVDDAGAVARALATAVEQWPLLREQAVANAALAAMRYSPERYSDAVCAELERLAPAADRRRQRTPGR
ncbi:hypothetical protein AL755_06120 [Arthrobacter sp. ERGS1:01]|uniref:glycosyltransferase n=1 Tax=Arthrobacter sp. ERGS1:01 TaxID=1704044 RepID=UPI0006B61DA9|nr:glycosyltransferase [Arthrobacter sp. ERGS1:01]ALE05154.1 hypothetical protein AL755_06120 [Arthrobacter sp. ERGS1:01]